MNPDPVNDEEHGRVLAFRPRRPRPPPRAFGNLSAKDSPVADLTRYDRGSEEDEDYGHRMKMNALAALVLILLIAGGMWLFDTMAELRRTQDCILSGQTNCAPVATPDER